MLHIIFLILKILGFLILGIFSFVLILLAIFLLVSVSYTVECSVDDSIESMKGNIHFHWLMHLLSGHFSIKNGSLTWQFRAGWKKFGSSRPSELNSEDSLIISTEKVSDKKENDNELPNSYDAPAGTEDLYQKRSSSEKKTETSSCSIPQKITKAEQRKRFKDTSSTRTSKRKKIYKIHERIKKNWEQIKCTFIKICDKISTLEEKKEKISSFFQNQIHRKAFRRVLKEIRRLLHFLRPRKMSLDLEFGFKNPAYTGYTLAGISMIYPFIGESAQIKPDFEHKRFRGKVYIKGKLRLIYMFLFAWNILWDKNIRITYRHIRKFRL